MAEKRKAQADAQPSKKVKISKSEKPKHDVKAAKETTTKKPSKHESTEKAKTSNERRPVAKSLLSQEEKSFPRGGASVLTPLEEKQIRAQAERDVLFEQETGKAAPGIGDDDLFDLTKAKGTKSKKRKGESVPDDHVARIQGLSFRNLVAGSLVIGRVDAITSKDVALTLPNNLTGFVPITAISPSLNKRIEALIEAEEDDEGEDDDDVELRQLFKVGQWLRAVVTTSNDKHIELSLDPALVNGGLSADQIAPNSFIQASVRSVEDHGVIMDLGIEGSTRGFIGKKDLGEHSLSVGQVMLCLVTGKGGDGKVVKLAADMSRFAAFGTTKQTPVLSEMPGVDILLPGSAVDVLIASSGTGGITGKVMGLVDVSADAVHAGTASLTGDEVAKKYVVAAKARARIIWSLPKDDGSRQVGVSFLNQMVAMAPPIADLGPNVAEKARQSAKALQQAIASSAIVEQGTITSVMQERGVYLDLQTETGVQKAHAHISQLTDTRLEHIQTDAGSFKVGSTHRVRILSFNALDGLYYVSLQESVLSQPFLRLEDIQLGSIVSGQVEKLLLGKGVTGIIVKLSKRITALVPAIHMSDAPLQHPEKKYREGFAVKGRVLSIDLDKRQVRVTLKKSLVASDAIWKDYNELKVGQEAQGTVINLLDHGAVVQYYGDVRAYLPVSEMSDAFVQSPSKHFRLGQTITTRIVSVDAEASQMKVSCRTAGQLDDKTEQIFEKFQPGQIVSVAVSAVLSDKVEVELEGGITGVIRKGQLLDGSASKAESRLKKLRVGQKLTETLVLSKHDRSKQIILTYKSSMVKDPVTSIKDIKTGQQVHGFVQNVTPEGVYVEFAGRTVALLPKSQLTSELLQQPSFGLRTDQSIAAWVQNVDEARSRFSLTMHEPKQKTESTKPVITTLSNPIDTTLSTTADLALNKIVKARVASVKSSQVNVRLADGVHGRIDVSEIFDSIAEIDNPQAPLVNRYQTNEIVEVKILGMRDSKGWRFLPFSHRSTGATLVELSAKKSRIAGNSDLLGGTKELKVGEAHLAFINNVAADCVWVTLSPAIRGRVDLMDLTNDLSQLQNMHKHFPIGSVLQVKVKKVSGDKLDLTAVHDTPAVTRQTLVSGDIISGRVTKIADHGVTVQLAHDLAVLVPLVELSDNFDGADPTKFSKNDIVRVRVLDVNAPNKRIALSLRPSLVLSSSLPIKDAHVIELAKLQPQAIVRGFVKHIGDKSVLVSLSGTIDAYVAVSDMSDKFIKDWQEHLSLHQLVKGRVLSVDAKSVRLSLKKSHVDADYKPPMKFDQIEAGMIVTGTARKVEDFGVFIDIDNTQPRISGLAHRSEIAEKRVVDVRSLYSQGDRVRAKVLKVDADSRKISLGLRASYFPDDASDVDADDAMPIDEAEDSGDEDQAIEIEGLDEPMDVDEESSDEEADRQLHEAPAGLSTSGFDWSGDALDGPTTAYDSEPDLAPKAKRRNKAEAAVDMTGDLDKHGPRTTSDFERLLLGQPNDSGLWIQYMAYHLQLSEIEKARELAERALRTIHIREIDEKANIWVALINLEVEYGDDDSTEAVFKKACQVQEPLEMHEKLASIYIDSGKLDKADDIFGRIIANKTFRASSEVWLNYANFLMARLQDADRARALLSRAMQSIHKDEHRLLTAKFAALEFRTEAGDPERGRTIFEALVSGWPKWTSGWDMWVDTERSRLDKLNGEEKAGIKEKVRELYERMSKAGMKKRRAKFVFKRWLEFEEQMGDAAGRERVTKLANEYVEQLKAKANGGEEDD